MNKRAKLKRYVWFEGKDTLKHLFEVNIFEFIEKCVFVIKQISSFYSSFRIFLDLKEHFLLLVV